jgi:hypothetical protein
MAKGKSLGEEERQPRLPKPNKIVLAADFQNSDNRVASLESGIKGDDWGRFLMIDRRIMTTRGVECVLNGAVIDKFASNLQGGLIAPNDQDYEAVRKVWNGIVDKRPALIALCTGAADVVTCVRFAREYDLLISVRGGGHSAGGRAVCEKGLMIDLSPMKRPDRFHRTDSTSRAGFAARRI